MKKLVFLTVLVFTGALQATVTLTFSATGGRATNFANADGSYDGSRYGIVIDSNNDGFAAGGLTYDAFDLVGTRATGTFLKVNGVTTDDFFFASWDPTLLGGAGDFRVTATSGGGQGGPGTITSISDIPFTLPGSIATANDPFGLLWLSTTTSNGTGLNDKYGFLAGLVGMTMPAGDGGSTPYGALVFAGSDPQRLASNTFGPIPEPSRAILVGIGLLGFLMRRRRA